MAAKPGRPSAYDADVAERILAQLMDGVTLREICRADDMPARSTVQLWAANDIEGFSGRYARAREIQLDEMAEELLEISDDGSNDWMLRKRDDGSTDEVVNHEHISRSKLRVDTRKWLLSKLMAAKYGDRTVLAGDKDAPIQSENKLIIEFVAPKG